MSTTRWKINNVLSFSPVFFFNRNPNRAQTPAATRNSSTAERRRLTRDVLQVSSEIPGELWPRGGAR
jgi:hypothetical protein